MTRKEYFNLFLAKGLAVNTCRGYSKSMEMFDGGNGINPETILEQIENANITIEEKYRAITAYNCYAELNNLTKVKNHYSKSRMKTRKQELTERRCQGCKWRSVESWGGNYVSICAYMIETGKRRGMKQEDCYKHEGTPYEPGKYRQGKNRKPRDIIYGHRYERICNNEKV